MKQVPLSSLKKHVDVSRTIAISKVEIFRTLVSGLHLLTNFTKGSILIVARVPNAPLQYYNLF